ncbi:unnamed protein product [Urochloa humidicola]
MPRNVPPGLRPRRAPATKRPTLPARLRQPGLLLVSVVPILAENATGLDAAARLVFDEIPGRATGARFLAAPTAPARIPSKRLGRCPAQASQRRHAESKSSTPARASTARPLLRRARQGRYGSAGRDDVANEPRRGAESSHAHVNAARPARGQGRRGRGSGLLDGDPADVRSRTPRGVPASYGLRTEVFSLLFVAYHRHQSQSVRRPTRSDMLDDVRSKAACLVGLSLPRPRSLLSCHLPLCMRA